MDILIVSATKFEIEPLLIHFTFEQDKHPHLKTYTYKNHTIDVIITGIGMTATAFMMGKTLTIKPYDTAINLGIAGSFDKDITLGETVHVVSDQISELGAEADNQFLPLMNMGLSENNSEIINSIPLQNSIILNLKQVKGITVNTTHGNRTSIDKIINRLNPQTESMEGAAFLSVCISENIKCAQIRTISNKVEKRNKDNWDIPLAINNLCKTGLEIIDTL
ncbi:MAG: futalosine hydrolase [Vicingaceae bacterium]